MRDLDRGTEAKLTFASGATSGPVWSPDGRRFACELRSGGRTQVMIGSVDGLGAVDTFAVEGLDAGVISQWSAAGSRLVYGPGSFTGVYRVSPDSANRAGVKVPGLPKVVGQPALSPDGRWLAYVTNEGTTSPQVYVQSLTGVPGRWQVSTTAGVFPTWTRGGKELLFETNGTMTAVDVESQGTFRAGQPRPLFQLPLAIQNPLERSWNCSEDGRRFFLLVPPRVSSRGGFEVVTDFNRLVKRK